MVILFYPAINLIVFIEILIGITLIFISDFWKWFLMINALLLIKFFETSIILIWFCVNFSQVICFGLKFWCINWTIMINCLESFFYIIFSCILNIFQLRMSWSLFMIRWRGKKFLSFISINRVVRFKDRAILRT